MQAELPFPSCYNLVNLCYVYAFAPHLVCVDHGNLQRTHYQPTAKRNDSYFWSDNGRRCRTLILPLASPVAIHARGFL